MIKFINYNKIDITIDINTILRVIKEYIYINNFDYSGDMIIKIHSLINIV